MPLLLHLCMAGKNCVPCIGGTRSLNVGCIRKEMGGGGGMGEESKHVEHFH